MAAVRALRVRGDTLATASQNVAEFWNVCTDADIEQRLGRAAGFRILVAARHVAACGPRDDEAAARVGAVAIAEVARQAALCDAQDDRPGPALLADRWVQREDF